MRLKRRMSAQAAVTEITMPPSKVLALDEEDPDLRKSGIYANLIQPTIIEFSASMMFLFLTVGHVVFNAGDSASPFKAFLDVDTGTIVAPNLTVLAISFAFGFSIFVLVYGTANVSGANINPAVTVALVATRRMSLTRGAVYVLAQCAGASLGCGIVLACTPTDWLDDDHLAIGYNKVISPFTPAGVFLAEVLGTSVLMFTVMAFIDSNQQKKGEHISTVGPFAVGMAVFLAHLVLIPIDGCSINPARSFGAAISANNWDDHWVFWLGPIIGSVTTAFTYDLLLDEKRGSSHCKLYMKGPEGW